MIPSWCFVFSISANPTFYKQKLHFRLPITRQPSGVLRTWHQTVSPVISNAQNTAIPCARSQKITLTGLKKNVFGNIMIAACDL